jgi:hypothetical protein
MSSCPHVLTRSFHLTISTRDPVTEQCQNAIVNYAREQTDYAYIVTETGKSGKLHLHAILIYDNHRDKRKLQSNITERIVKKNGHPDAKGGVAVYIQVCPGHKWYDEYLNKEPGRIVLYNHYDRDAVTPYFPTQEVQEYLQTHTRSSGPVDKHMAEHKRQWIDRFPDDSSYECAIQYLKYRMYVLEDMMIIQDKRRLNQLAYSLYEYRNQILLPDAEDRNYANRMTANSMSV